MNLTMKAITTSLCVVSIGYTGISHAGHHGAERFFQPSWTQAPVTNSFLGRRGPPPEAIEACEGKKEGDSCEFEGRRGKVTGTCQTRRDQLVCVSKNKRKKHRRGPPPEAVDACKGKKEGDSCEFEGRRGQVTGTCQTRRDRLVCRPEKRRRRDE